MHRGERWPRAAESSAAAEQAGGWRRLLLTLALAVAYFAAARLGLSLAAVHGIATVVWPPTGIAMATLLIGGTSLWPGVLGGAIAANLLGDVPWWASAIIGVGNTLEAVCGASLLRRLGVYGLNRLQEVLALVLAGALFSPVISATLGVGAAVLAGAVPLDDAPRTWSAWWLGDALGALIIAPLILTWRAKVRAHAWPRRGETIVCLVAMLLTGAMIFGGAKAVPPLAYLIFPFIVWSALRLGQAATTATVSLVAALAISGTLIGSGPFTGPSPLHGLLNVQFFMAVVATTAMTLGAVIAERTRSQEDLHEVRTRLQLVTDTMSVPVTRCSRDLRYLWVSVPYAEWLGRTPEQITGQAIVDVIGEEALAAIRPYIDQVLTGERVEYEEEVNFSGPGRRWINAVYAPTTDVTGSVDGWVAVVVDVTARRQLEQQLRDEGKRKDEFLAMLAHELRNPLAPIRNALQLFRIVAPPEARLVQAREMIERQVSHMVRLIDDLLDVSRVSQGKIALVTDDVDLHDALTEAIETARPLLEQRAHTLNVSLTRDPLRIHGDRTRLVQVFGNLLQNAAKFTPTRGQVTLTSEYRDGAAVVRVRDTGIGLTAEARERIFELFVQEELRLDRTLGGLGIGLTLVRQLVALHGGSVEAASPGIGQGSEFIVTLPARPFVPRAVDSREVPSGAAVPLRILVVEDNFDAAQSFILLLELAGHQVRSAPDGHAAVEIEEEYAPDIAFVDLGLPGLDGYDVVRRLRQRPAWRGTVFVALSGYGREEDMRRSREAGFDHHLVKPVDPLRIDELLAQLVRWRTHERRNDTGNGDSH